jgi:AraC family transcriptional regulator, regulatory protein of adaptative response / methylated-DNA-[protein]-cysteine methyltransferase
MTQPATTTNTIRYASRRTQLGLAFAATTERGVCLLQLIDAKDGAVALAELRQRHPKATLVKDDKALADVFHQIDALADGADGTAIALDLHGTPFQQKVWQALRRVPLGKTATYTELARRAGAPKAVRAAASACARNPVALFVPCHRIVRRDGGLGGYAGGVERKRRLLELEGVLMPA